MEKNKHKPPSRKRYEKNYPVWSVRMPKEWIDEMELLLENTEQSRRNFLGVALKKQKANYKRVYTRGYHLGHNHGYDRGHIDGCEKGKEDLGITFPCTVCGELIYIPPNSDCHKAVIEFLKEHNWGHPSCHQQQSTPEKND